MRLSNADMRKKFFFETDERSLERANLKREILEDLRRAAGESDLFQQEFDQLIRYREELRQIMPNAETSIILPVNLTRLLWNAKKLFNIDPRAALDLHPFRVVEVSVVVVVVVCVRCLTNVRFTGASKA